MKRIISQVCYVRNNSTSLVIAIRLVWLALQFYYYLSIDYCNDKIENLAKNWAIKKFIVSLIPRSLLVLNFELILGQKHIYENNIALCAHKAAKPIRPKPTTNRYSLHMVYFHATLFTEDIHISHSLDLQIRTGIWYNIFVFVAKHWWKCILIWMNWICFFYIMLLK